ncbi:Ger(x)C family spore germination protein [Paenibacillus psychroresistens]|uniref:Ger(X)C family spore germination protein n=1 Tax=Paenibacillus psychroresistens TaxID=1778678 RepID=A0A6B8RI16_9BACL|nr:Ger(x)C family spore germination protein [Paenibacillus psychroresistens]QGQ95192.1 Ger(x)C family spore germination protein [Paenibacillus psychroresistens]
MRKKIFLAVIIGLLSVVLSGCWDIHYLINKKMINGISLDAAKDNQITATVRAINLESKGGGQFDVKDELIQATGDSVFNIGNKIDSMLPGTLEPSKAHVVIIGEELAKRGIMSPLEFIYRSPKGYLKSNVLISTGLASEVISIEKLAKSPVAFDIKQMVVGAEGKTIVPKQTLYSLWSQISDPDADLVLPMIRIVRNKTLIIDRVGLFNGDKFTGVTLSRDDSILLMLLKNKLNRHAFMDIPISQSPEQDKSKEIKTNLITFEARKSKRSFKVFVDKNTQKIECFIKVDLYGELRSYSSNLGTKIDREQLNQELSASLNKQAAGVANSLLEANCDALGIGRKLRVNHSELWKNIDWENKYKDVKLKPTIQVHIISTGLIN